MVKASSNGLSSDLAGGADTIVARATAAGRGALAVIRISGSETPAIARRLCPELRYSRGWKAALVELFDANGESLERAVAIPYPGPRSYTGEDMLEVSVHGSPYLVEAAIETCVAAGARRAEAGEFTRRAVANGKLDLIQAEAVADLIEADSASQLRNAREQLAGRLSAEFLELRHNLVGVLALIEAELDYEAQGVVVDGETTRGRLAVCSAQLEDLLGRAGAGDRIREGLRTVILGPPNAGKSTLFNRLCGSDRAILSPQPGTTRDVIDAEIEIAGVRIVLHDTAGLRVGGGAVEAEGHRRARGAAAAADLAIFLWPADAEEAEPALDVLAGLEVIRVRSKADLGVSQNTKTGWLAVSGVTGQGFEELRTKIAAVAETEIIDLGGSVAIGGRHRAALDRARREIRGCDVSRPEVAAERVRWAIRAVEEMIGAVDTEEVLDEVFSTFCIGK